VCTFSPSPTDLHPHPPPLCACPSPLRPLVPNFQVTVANGAAVLLHVAALDSGAVQADVKYVLASGRLECAVNGVTNVHKDDQGLGQALLALCDAKARPSS
jgi:hypothetical protein